MSRICSNVQIHKVTIPYDLQMRSLRDKTSMLLGPVAEITLALEERAANRGDPNVVECTPAPASDVINANWWLACCVFYCCAWFVMFCVRSCLLLLCCVFCYPWTASERGNSCLSCWSVQRQGHDGAPLRGWMQSWIRPTGRNKRLQEAFPTAKFRRTTNNHKSINMKKNHNINTNNNKKKKKHPCPRLWRPSSYTQTAPARPGKPRPRPRWSECWTAVDKLGFVHLVSLIHPL